MAVRELQGDQFQKEVLNSPVPVLVDFYAPWCGPCKLMAPVLEEVAQSVGAKAAVVKLNVEQAQEIAGKYKVTSIPTLFVVKDGMVVGQWRGVQKKEDLIKALLQ